MTNAISVADIRAQQDALYKDFTQAQGALQEAQARFAEKKTALITFNNKYGRIIAMMDED